MGYEIAEGVVIEKHPLEDCLDKLVKAAKGGRTMDFFKVKEKLKAHIGKMRKGEIEPFIIALLTRRGHRKNHHFVIACSSFGSTRYPGCDYSH